jgi:hypothetical protein
VSRFTEAGKRLRAKEAERKLEKWNRAQSEDDRRRMRGFDALMRAIGVSDAELADDPGVELPPNVVVVKVEE